MADKYFLAKKTDAKITAAQVENLEKIAKLTPAANVANATSTATAQALANALKDIMVNMGLMVAD